MTSLQNLFVAKLPRNLSDEDLQQVFKDYNPISAKIMLDPSTGKSKGFGFVLFDTEDKGRVAYEALNKTHVSMLGHNFHLCIFPSKHDGKVALEVSNSLYVRNIPRSESQEAVEEFLRQFGKLTFCSMREDHHGASVWVVYAEYETVDDAKAALQKLHNNRTFFKNSLPILAKHADSDATKLERRKRREQNALAAGMMDLHPQQQQQQYPPPRYHVQGNSPVGGPPMMPVSQHDVSHVAGPGLQAHPAPMFQPPVQAGPYDPNLYAPMRPYDANMMVQPQLPQPSQPVYNDSVTPTQPPLPPPTQPMEPQQQPAAPQPQQQCFLEIPNQQQQQRSPVLSSSSANKSPLIPTAFLNVNHLSSEAAGESVASSGCRPLSFNLVDGADTVMTDAQPLPSPERSYRHNPYAPVSSNASSAGPSTPMVTRPDEPCVTTRYGTQHRYGSAHHSRSGSDMTMTTPTSSALGASGFQAVPQPQQQQAHHHQHNNHFSSHFAHNGYLAAPGLKRVASAGFATEQQ